MNIPVYVLTSNKHLWCMRPFSYCFDAYWGSYWGGQNVIVAGYEKPSDLPYYMSFYQIANDEIPADKWSDGLIRLLSSTQDEFFIFMLEDYLLTRPVDLHAISALGDLMSENSQILRIDLTTDVLHANGDSRDASDVGYLGSIDLVEKKPGTQYRFSFQAGIWNKAKLLEILKPGMSPWNVELYTEIPEGSLIYGTRQWPVRYANLLWKSKVDLAQLKLLHPEKRDAVITMISEDLLKGGING